MNSWNDPSVVAASLSAVAAIAAAIATWRGPISAARMAEALRSKAEVEADKRRFKLNIFAQLMQERAEIYSIDSVRALNSIDIAFFDAVNVREAWSELYQALNSQPISPSHVTDERFRKLLREIASDLGIADKLRLDDFSRVYYPRVISEQREIQHLERAATFARLTGQSGNSAQPTNEALSIFPPKPE